jgi:cytochrome c556
MPRVAGAAEQRPPNQEENHHMVRIMLAVTASLFAVTAVLAQSDLVEQRTALMKGQGRYIYRDLARMMRGDDPYDQAKVDEAFAKLKDSSAKIESVFPASSKGRNDAKSDYITLDKLWDNKADFDARVAKLQKVLEQDAPKAKSQEGFKTVYPEVRKTCDDCHEAYRAKKS